MDQILARLKEKNENLCEIYDSIIEKIERSEFLLRDMKFKEEIEFKINENDSLLWKIDPRSSKGKWRIVLKIYRSHLEAPVIEKALSEFDIENRISAIGFLDSLLLVAEKFIDERMENIKEKIILGR